MEPWVNITGITLNIIGVALLAKFPIDPETPSKNGLPTLNVNPGASRIQKSLIKYDIHLSYTKLGFFLIGLGFVLQLYASWPT
ncbi:hypothetical protein MJO52_05385 [Microbulbifer variabilis]|uniref:Uncharacterized protein n=1 Tax=Microbulbifer variabilis TaxID=266805 RepID=A0ABY4VGP3_9GAMM|nr:hypothetical protein [Microbulbifer variabilis]USD22566.1 hypothetical protein MJO52_05385 [Microbulbifer variabilis]